MKIRALIGLALLAALLAIRPAAAQESPDVFHACYVPTTGVVYLIGEEDLPSTCRAPRHVEFSWTDGDGDATDPAPSGPAGGDLGGTYPAPSVQGIQEVPVSATAPEDGDALVYDAAAGAWRSTALGEPGSGGGLDGYEIVTQEVVTTAAEEGGAPIIVRATCPPGKRVVGGGFEQGTSTYQVRESTPTFAGSGWQVVAVYIRDGTARIQAWAVCVGG